MVTCWGHRGLGPPSPRYLEWGTVKGGCCGAQRDQAGPRGGFQKEETPSSLQMCSCEAGAVLKPAHSSSKHGLRRGCGETGRGCSLKDMKTGRLGSRPLQGSRVGWRGEERALGLKVGNSNMSWKAGSEGGRRRNLGWRPHTCSRAKLISDPRCLVIGPRSLSKSQAWPGLCLACENHGASLRTVLINSGFSGNSSGSLSPAPQGARGPERLRMVGSVHSAVPERTRLRT